MTSEFYVNTFTSFFSARDSKQRIFIAMNTIVNVISTLCICYATANILKVSNNYVDIILNSVAIFFVCELDDILITDVEVELLNEERLSEYVKLCIQYSTSKGNKTDYVALEIISLYAMAIGNIIVFIIALLHFTGYEDIAKYGLNDSWYILIDKVI